MDDVRRAVRLWAIARGDGENQWLDHFLAKLPVEEDQVLHLGPLAGAALTCTPDRVEANWSHLNRSEVVWRSRSREHDDRGPDPVAPGPAPPAEAAASDFLGGDEVQQGRPELETPTAMDLGPGGGLGLGLDPAPDEPAAEAGAAREASAGGEDGPLKVIWPEYCPGEFYAGWWVYCRDRDDGSRNDGGDWGWIRDGFALRPIRDLCIQLGWEHPPEVPDWPGGGTQFFAEWFAAAFPRGIWVRDRRNEGGGYEPVNPAEVYRPTAAEALEAYFRHLRDPEFDDRVAGLDHAIAELAKDNPGIRSFNIDRKQVDVHRTIESIRSGSISVVVGPGGKRLEIWRAFW